MEKSKSDNKIKLWWRNQRQQNQTLMEKSKSDNKIIHWWRNQSQTTKSNSDGEIKDNKIKRWWRNQSKTTKFYTDGEIKDNKIKLWWRNQSQTTNQTLMEKSKTTKSNSNGEIKARQQIKLWYRNQSQTTKSYTDGEIKVRQQNETLMEKSKWDNKIIHWWRNQSEWTRNETSKHTRKYLNKMSPCQALLKDTVRCARNPAQAFLHHTFSTHQAVQAPLTKLILCVIQQLWWPLWSIPLQSCKWSHSKMTHPAAHYVTCVSL